MREGRARLEARSTASGRRGRAQKKRRRRLGLLGSPGSLKEAEQLCWLFFPPITKCLTSAYIALLLANNRK